MKLYIYLVFLSLSFLCASTHAQQKKPSLEVGIKLMAEANSGAGSTMPFSGVQLIYQKGKHGGLETGLFYRTVRNQFFTIFYNPVTNSSNTITSTLSERFLSLPVLYHFQSRVVNFSVGPSFDIFLGWKDKSDKNIVTITSYNRSSTIEIGGVASVSKTIQLTEKLALEPEVRFNPIFTSGDPYAHTAFGFAVKYKL